jgi:hypothetical protein
MSSVQSSALYFCYQLLPSPTQPDAAPTLPESSETAANLAAAVQPSTLLCHSRFSRPAPCLVLVHCASTVLATAVHSLATSTSPASVFNYNSTDGIMP